MKLRKKAKTLPISLFLIPAITLFSFACSLPNLGASHAPTEIPRLSTLIDLPASETPSAAPVETEQVLPPTPTSVQLIENLQLNDLFPYVVQSGDTLPALAARFRTTSADIAAENPSLPQLAAVTTLSPGQQLMIRLKVEPTWDTLSPVLPNSLFVNGPAQADFDTQGFISRSNGWLKRYVDRNGENPVTGTQIVDSIAQNYSISPRLILAVLEYKLNALTDPAFPSAYSLGSPDEYRITIAKQLSWAANVLNNGYYGWREGALIDFNNPYGVQVVPNPGQNAASVALQYYFSRFSNVDETLAALSPGGLMQTYQALFGVVDWHAEIEASFIPGDLQQPALLLPMQPGLKWAFTAGPHSGWGIGFPWAAIDFAPPSEVAGCDPSVHWAAAMADGVIARSEGGVVVLDLDGDGKAQTGWTLFYLHIDPVGAPRVGTRMKKGDLIGHPSCVGGQSTGRNLHIARLYNGEWISAGSTLAFNMDGWVVVQGDQEYKGYLSRDDELVFPSKVGEGTSQIMADPLP